MMEKEVSSPCLLCSSPAGIPLPAESTSPTGLSSSENNKELNSGLWSVFVLRKLLHFPQWELEGLLRGMGGVSPGDWFTLCQPCSQLAKQTMELHHQVFELERKISDKRAEAIDKLRSSFLLKEEKTVDHRQQEVGVGGRRCAARTAVREYFRVHLRGRQPEQLRASSTDDDNSLAGSGSERSDQQSSYPPSPSLAAASVKPEVMDSNDDDDHDQSNLDEEQEDPLYIPKQRHIIISKVVGGSKRKPRGGGTKVTVARKQRKSKKIYNSGSHLHLHHPNPSRISVENVGGAPAPAPPGQDKKTPPRRCKYCDYTPHPDLADLARHERKHEEDPGYVFFSCDKCDYSCSTHSRKWAHVQKHKIEDHVERRTTPSGAKISCKVCSAEFEDLAKVTAHLRESHGPQLGLKQYKCSECDKVCSSGQTLRIHKAKVHDPEKSRRYSCSECDFGCYLKASWEEHRAAFHSGGRKENVCDICGTAVSTKSALRNHKARNHRAKKQGTTTTVPPEEQQQYACNQCEFVAPGLTQLNRHKHGEHPELLLFQCSECPQKFMKMNRMVHHYRIRHPGKKSLDSGKSLDSLDRDHHDDDIEDVDDGSRNLGEDEPKPKEGKGRKSEGRMSSGRAAVPGEGTYCSICRKWILPESYPDHVKMHAARQCKYCDYIPKTNCGRWDLARHERKHEEDPSYVFFSCDKCDFTCSTHSRKNAHRQKHKLDDNIVVTSGSGASSSTMACKICSAVFENYAEVTAHLREVHGGQLGLKQYKCSECAMVFSSSSALRSHVITQHEKQLRYSCEQCEFSCYAKASWDNHLAAFHSGGAKEVICDLCGKAVATKSGLRNHKRRVHRPDGEVPHPNAVEGHACKLCDFVTTNNILLEGHKQREHPELFQFQCSECPQRFIKLHRMVCHYRIKHPGVRVNAS